MKDSNKQSGNIIKFLNGKAFYVIMCICFIAIGVAVWTGVEGFGSRNDDTAPSTASESKVLPDTGRLFGKIENDISKSGSEKSDMSSDAGSETAVPSVDETAEAVSPAAKYFIFPVIGEIIKDFSDTELQYSLTFRDMRLHNGIDIAADSGTPVIASGDGTVTAVYSDPYLGTVVEIDHGNGIKVKYCGLNAAPSVSNGDTVDSSVMIGTVSTVPSESVDQNHLHVEFSLDGKAVSPLKYLK